MRTVMAGNDPNTLHGYVIDCPECGKPMHMRTNRKSNLGFWGCSDFPRCKGTRTQRDAADWITYHVIGEYGDEVYDMDPPSDL